MHTFTETGTGVPAFLAKLWRLVDDPETNNLICWSKDGRSFIIQNQAQFARELLPLNYKHNNMASFIRQLNMYGFHKITSIDNGGLKFDRDEMEFSHPCFKRNCPYLLEHIKRKIANTKSIDEKSAIKPEAVSKVLQDVKAMRGRQDSLDSRFSVMKQENEALWREIASLRQKHAKQQQIVNKLIQFLITIVQPSRNMTSVKRHMQLMINDSPDNAKLRKTSESETDCGPVIHELGEELLDEVTENEIDLMDPNSPYAASVSTAQMDNESLSPHHIERPHSSNSMISQNYDFSNQSVDDVLNIGVGGSSGVAGASARGGQSIIQSVNPDGSKIVYHVTEVPDAHPTETIKTVPANFHDDNILTTPMVREQMARSQQLKQKNKQRRNLTATSDIADGDTRTSSPVAVKLLRQNQNKAGSTNEHEIQIKSEHEIDPMLFLNVYPDNRIFTPDPPMTSPNLSEDSCQSNGNQGTTLANASTLPTKSTPITNKSTDLYNPNDFIASGMPSDIFEDSSLIGGENSNFEDNFKATKQMKQQQQLESEQQQLQQQQQEFGFNTANNGKFASFVSGNNNPNVASTSAAAAAAANTAGLSGAATNSGAANSDTAANNRNQNKDKSGNGNAMAVTKYSKNGTNNNDGGVMRLSTADEVHGHLDNMQDELESLKDLLRGDGYSLDSNTLLGNGATSATLNNNRIYLNQALDGDFFTKLFNDADILGPYGLSLSNENSSDKKGSELMAYQPIYDLSDIMGINDKADLDEGNNISSPSANPRQLQTQSSVLNTPRHE